MDNKILYTAGFTHHYLKFHKVWWKSDKRCGSWSGQTDRQIPIYPPQTMFAGGIIKKGTIYTDRNRNRLFAVIPFTNLFGKWIFSI